MKLKNLETENFRIAQETANQYNIKATSALAKSYNRLKKLSNPNLVTANSLPELFAHLEALEASLIKLAGI